MSSVYSGGIAYEYSLEPNEYGIVEINGDSVEELEDFDSLKEAYDAVVLPSGDGGAKEEGEASECPAQSEIWDVEDDSLPAVPEPVLAMFDDGVDEGFGLVEGDPGSQNAGTPSDSIADPEDDAAGGDDEDDGGDGEDGDGEEDSASLSRASAMICGLVAVGSVLGASLF